MYFCLPGQRDPSTPGPYLNIKTTFPGPVSCLLLGVSSDSAQSITGQVTELTCPVIGQAQPEITLSKRQKTGPGYRDSHFKDKTVIRPSYLYNGNSVVVQWYLYTKMHSPLPFEDGKLWFVEVFLKYPQYLRQSRGPTDDSLYTNHSTHNTVMKARERIAWGKLSQRVPLLRQQGWTQANFSHRTVSMVMTCEKMGWLNLIHTDGFHKILHQWSIKSMWQGHKVISYKLYLDILHPIVMAPDCTTAQKQIWLNKYDKKHYEKLCSW